MNIISLILTGLVISSIVFVIISLVLLFQIIIITKKLSNIKRKNTKKKKKVRKILIRRQSKLKWSSIACVILGLTLGIAAYYGQYYQSIKLTSEDEKLIVISYYLLRDFQDELENASIDKVDEKSFNQSVRQLSTALSSYTSKKASTLNSIEGQLKINRYYNCLSQIGINATRESPNLYGNNNLIEDFKTDVDKAIKYEESVFKYFKVNQNNLKYEGLKNEAK